MRTEGFKRGAVSILLVFALMFSMISVVPLASPGDWVNNPEPGGTTIEVVPGDTFLIRHTLEWDEPEDGAYKITIAWDCYDNEPSQNFTFVDNSAYFTTGPNAGESILAEVSWLVVPSPDYPGSTRYILSVSCPADQKDSRNGQFNVDVTLGAYGAGGVPHIPGDHVIPSQFGGIIIIEKYPQYWNRDPITIRVLAKLISISPNYQGGPPGTTLEYIVTVTNIGENEDNFDLTVSDSENWGPTLDDYRFENIPPGGNRITTLRVTVPLGAIIGTRDRITVTVISQSDPNVRDNVVVEAIAQRLGIVRGKDTAYNITQTGDPPWYEYEIGDRPLVMVAKEIGSGGVVAAGIVPTCRTSPTPGWKNPDNPFQYLDILFDEAFRWMVPGAVNVLWYEGYNVYNTASICSELVEALGLAGYTVTADATMPITSGLLSAYDILVLPQLQLGTAGTGGDPDLLPDADVQAIKSFVEGGGGLFIMDGSDFGGHHYSKVMNKVLESLGFDYFFQDDQISDPTNNWANSDYRPIVDVDPTTDIGSAYQAATGATEIGLYSICSLAKAGPGVSLYILPDYQVGLPGATLEYSVIVSNPKNPLAIDLTYDLTFEESADWSSDIHPTSVFVQVGESEDALLIVTIPDDAPMSTDDTIVVTATARGYPEVQTSFTTVAHAGKRIEPTDDTYVSDQDSDANYSGENSLRVGRYYEYWQWPYLKFDLSEIPSDANITDVRLYLYAYYKYAGGFDVLCHEVDDDDWMEIDITWNNKPAYGALLDTEFVDYASHESPKSYSWDVTSFVVDEFAGDQWASFCLRSPDDLPDSTSRAFWSKERYESRTHPFLRVSYTTGVVEYKVSVSISPYTKSGSPGETLTFTVTVRNEGTLDDSYSLTVTDTAGWSPSISPSMLTLAAGVSDTATLTVTIPSDAENGATDSITVTATSQADSTVSASDTCTAIAAAVEEAFYSTSIQGDYVAAGVGMRSTGSGTITISGIPGGSTIVKAFLYWAIVDVSEGPSFKGGVFDGTSITGTLIGTDDDPCWGSTTTTFVYRADVTALVPGNGIYSLTGFATGPGFTTPPLLEGASLVIVFSNPASAYRDIVIFDGADTIDGVVSSVSTTISGFTASAAPSAKTTYIVADGQDQFSDDTLFNGVIIASDASTLGDTTSFEGSDGELWDTDTYDVSALVSAGDTSATVKLQRGTDCLVHIAQVFSVTSLVPRVGWDALITATFSQRSDDAIFSVRPDATVGFDSAYDLPEPPPPVEPPYVQAYFHYPGAAFSRLHRSCIPPGGIMQWPLRVSYRNGMDNITLSWNLENVPPDYVVLLFEGENLVADMRAVDNYTFEAESGDHDFKVVVGTLVTYTLELVQGWNMISFPVLPENSSPDSIFDGYYVLYRWDAVNKRYVLHADSGSFIEPDPDVEAGVGYWVYVLEDENMNLLGVPVNQLTLSLHQGWNLIGPPYGGSSIADPIDDPDNTVLNWAFTWDADQKRYVMAQLLEHGKGYWVYALMNCSLVLFG